MRSTSEFPWFEFNSMLFALLRHVEHLDARLQGRARELELVRIMSLLEQAGCHQASTTPWKDARVVRNLLLECIQRQRGNRHFAEDVALMRAAAEAFDDADHEPSMLH